MSNEGYDWLLNYPQPGPSQYNQDHGAVSMPSFQGLRASYTSGLLASQTPVTTNDPSYYLSTYRPYKAAHTRPETSYPQHISHRRPTAPLSAHYRQKPQYPNPFTSALSNTPEAFQRQMSQQLLTQPFSPKDSMKSHTSEELYDGRDAKRRCLETPTTSNSMASTVLHTKSQPATHENLSSFSFSPRDTTDMSYLKNRVDIVQLLDKSDATVKTTYDPRTIARDVLIAAGRHPTEPALNHHLTRLRDVFVHVDNSSDLATFRWDLVDAERLKKPRDPPGAPVKVSAPPKEPSLPTPPTHMIQTPSQLSTPQPPQEQPFEHLRSQPSESTGYIAHFDARGSSQPQPEPQVHLPTGSPSAQLNTRGLSQPQPQPQARIPTGSASAQLNTRGSSQPRPEHQVQQPTGSPSAQLNTRGSSQPRPEHQVQQPTGSPSAQLNTRGLSQPRPQPQVQLVTGSPSTKLKTMVGKRGPGRPPGPSRTPGRPPGSSKTPVATPSAVHAPYPVFACDWDNCHAELHNLEMLAKHIYKVHVPYTITCEWKGCSCDDKLPAAQLVQHIRSSHLDPIAWRLGDGPSVPETVGSHASNSPVPSTIPESHLAGCADSLIFPANYTSIRAFNRVHGNNTQHDKAQGILKAVQRLKEQIGVGLDPGGCQLATPARNERVSNEEEVYEVKYES